MQWGCGAGEHRSCTGSRLSEASTGGGRSEENKGRTGSAAAKLPGFKPEHFSVSAIGVEIAVLERDAAVDGLGANGGSAGTDAGVEALPRIPLNVDGKLPPPCQELRTRAIRKAPSAARETGQDLQ